MVNVLRVAHRYNSWTQVVAWVAVNPRYTVCEECKYGYSIAKQKEIYGIYGMTAVSVVNVIDRWEEHGDIFKVLRALNAHCNAEVAAYDIIVREKYYNLLLTHKEIVALRLDN